MGSTITFKLENKNMMKKRVPGKLFHSSCQGKLEWGRLWLKGYYGEPGLNLEILRIWKDKDKPKDIVEN